MTQARLFGGRYELGELIGYGGMAEVHRGRDVRLGRDVAIKVLRSDLAREASFQTRFRREAQAAARLNHPAIVAVYDTGEEVGPTGPVPYIVMEFVEGRTLRDILRAEGSLPPVRAMEICSEVCSALDYSHRAGIVHRDIKPANVMITRTGAVKVMDFGIARAVADDAATVTQTAAVIGTAQYLSPEQARGEAVDARSDVYSCGCMLYELITGRPPFTGDSPVAVAYQHVREIPPLPSTINPDIPRALDSVTMKALAKNPQNRYQTAGEMGSDLSRILADQPVRAETVLTDEERTQFIRTPSGIDAVGLHEGGEDDSRSSRRGAAVWLAVVVVLLIVIGGIAYLVIRNTGDSTPQVTVPLVVGKTSEQAADGLRQAGFTPAANPATSNGPCGDGGSQVTVAEGNVCTQQFQNGTKQPKGTTISFTVFKQGTVNVPSVSGLTYEQAYSQLTTKGFQVSRVDANNGATPGQVVAQDPPANTKVAPGSTITLQVANGKVPLPDVTGMTYNDAVAALNQAGFTSNIIQIVTPNEDPDKGGLVQSENPTAGTAITPGEAITLTVAGYPTPTPSCTTPGSIPTIPTGGTTPTGPVLPACTTTSAGGVPGQGAGG